MLSAADEAFAVRLQAHDEAAWRELLGGVSPTAGDRVADKVANIMDQRIYGGVEYSEMGDMIREMLYTRAEIKAKAESLERWPVDPEQDYGGDLPTYEYDEEDWKEWEAMRDQWLQKQSKATLIKMVLMDDMEKEHYINTHMDDSEAE